MERGRNIPFEINNGVVCGLLASPLGTDAQHNGKVDHVGRPIDSQQEAVGDLPVNSYRDGEVCL